MNLEIIKSRKRELGLSNIELSQLSGIPLGTLSKIMAGIIDNPKLSTLHAMTKALGCTLDDLIDGDTEDMSDVANIGNRIAELRKNLNLTQQELADAAHTTKQNICRYEMGIITNIPAGKIKLIADKLNISPAFLMGWEETPTITLTAKEETVIKKYRAQPEMQSAVDRLLGVDN